MTAIETAVSEMIEKTSSTPHGVVAMDGTLKLGDTVAQGDVLFEVAKPLKGGTRILKEQHLVPDDSDGGKHFLHVLVGEAYISFPKDWPNPESLEGPMFRVEPGSAVECAHKGMGSHGPVTCRAGDEPLTIAVGYQKVFDTERRKARRVLD